MRLLYKHEHHGVWFSENGHKAYLRGEKPRFMWPENVELIPTCEHHIARQHPGAARMAPEKAYTRELVMFYRRSDAQNASNSLAAQED